MDWRSHIYTDPAICHGQVCIRGTRVPVAVVLDNLAAGVGENGILESYPTLRLDDIAAAVAYAAELAREHIVDLDIRD
ncbi:MAG: DUF433 domain-containing protein [Pseudomonadota bacterium]